jgi:MFS family permease
MEGRAKMPFVVWSWTLARGLLLLMALATRSLPFVMIAVATMFIGTVATPAYTSIMKEVYPDRSRGRLMGSIRMGLQAMTLVSTLIVGRLLDLTSYRVVFPIAGLVGIVAAFAFSRIVTHPAETDGTKVSVLSTLSILRDDANYRWFGLSVFIYGFGNLMAVPVYTIFQVDTLHITNTQVANLANVSSAVMILAYIFWGAYLDRHGPLQGVAAAVLVGALVPLVYLFAHDVRTLYLMAIAMGVTNAGIDLSYINSILVFADERRIAQYQSLHSALLGVRGIIGPFAGAALMQAAGVQAVFVVSLVMILAGFLLQTLGVKARYSA